jgi:hypothetical protein
MAVTLSITSDLVMPLSAENLPQTVTLTAAGVDSADNAASFNYSWHIIDKPTGSNAVLSALVGTNITIDIDVWGTYRVFCIATNLATNESSEDNPYAAPLDSFFSIRVLSENYDLEKPAKSQRNWHPQYWHLVDTVENMASDPATFLAGGSVEIATGREIAQIYSRSDSTSGEHYLAVTTEELYAALHPTVNGILGAGSTNSLRDRVKEIALEMINESSVSALKDVDTTTATPTNGQILVWDATHVDDTNGDVGAWVPGDLGEVVGNDGLFTFDLCSGETLDDGDFLYFDSDCTGGGPVSIAGWHARNRTYPTLAPKFPFASPGRTSTWHTTAEAAGLDWDDNTAHVGMVGVADHWEIARGVDYDVNTYFGSALTSALASGLLPSLAMTPAKFVSAAIVGNAAEAIAYALSDEDSSGTSDVFYDQYYHTAAEIATLQAAVDAETYETLRINVPMSALTAFVSNRVARLSIDTLSDVDTTSTTPTLNDVLQWDGTNWVPGSGAAGAASVGDANDIQLADGSGGFTAANWNITSNHLLPEVTNSYDVGSSTKKVRKVWGYDADFADDVRVGDALTVVGQAIFQDYAYVNDDGAAGTLLLQGGENGAIAGSVRNLTDNVIIEGSSSGTDATLTFKAQGATNTQQLKSNSGKLSNNNSIKLPAMASAPSVGDFLRTTVVSGRDVEVEFESIPERIVYSTHVSREVTEEGSFDGSGNLVFSGNQQACMYWVRNLTGSTLTLKATHIHIGEMKNVSLSFSIVKATTSANAISNTWTQVGSTFTLNNSSGTDNVVGQAQADVYTTTSITAGQYIGIVCTDIPALNRDDRRIVITFDCEKTL